MPADHRQPGAAVEVVRSFVAWADLRGYTNSNASPPLPERWRQWQSESLTIRWLPRAHGDRRAIADTLPILILGDDSEWQPARPDLCLAGGVPLRLDPSGRSLIAHTSIVGLPPIFLYRGAGTIALASDIHLLKDVPNVEFELDPQGVSELGTIGHPVEHRTLFRRVSLQPSGARITLGPDGTFTIEDAWNLPAPSSLSWPDFIECQIGAFTEAVTRLDVLRSFLSLTAGLDTRTVFAALAGQGRLVPAATMTGVRRSLDARTAARLCRAYDVSHHSVTFDQRFTDGLSAFVETASRLSGGLSSLDQAPEVYLYEQLGDRYSTRISGNLGNQVGRGGTEGVSIRGADLRILTPDLRSPSGNYRGHGHWLLDELSRTEHARIEFILKNEIPFTLVNNYTIGSHYAKQQTPYASRSLIESLSRRPASATGPSDSMVRMRLRDLSHRFLGESESHSFQRSFIRREDGFAARIPINWGWRAAGGVSPSGLAIGTATLFGMYARARGMDGGILKGPLAWSGIPALHDFRESRRWLRDSLREFTLDTLTSVREAALFDRRTLETVLTEHFKGKADRYQTVTFALDLALANRNFTARTTV
jgi:hypothetical protein